MVKDGTLLGGGCGTRVPGDYKGFLSAERIRIWILSDYGFQSRDEFSMCTSIQDMYVRNFQFMQLDRVRQEGFGWFALVPDIGAHAACLGIV